MIRPEWQERIRRLVDDWPPVSEETYARLALLLAPEQRLAEVPAPSVAVARPTPEQQAA
ncbi:hypothetical protein ACFOOM_07770 [Streptomyces echinoruber]|uniref:Uncharacterized protein n=1 Tax=Streptomyces echinoruber TaxID=68898 RepID=A0A918R0U6_9ACTN|nr:hypothetical protein [Streptomyces echinoruber]GGZ80486.1 hypothetical protein GCM10010389_17930 [Streptomyces echinoruber]